MKFTFNEYPVATSLKLERLCAAWLDAERLAESNEWNEATTAKVEETYAAFKAAEAEADLQKTLVEVERILPNVRRQLQSQIFPMLVQHLNHKVQVTS